MTDLSKWDYAFEFQLYEAAALIAGIDPATIYVETKPSRDNPRIFDYHEHPQIKPIIDRMKFSFHEGCDLYYAMHHGHWRHDTDEPLPATVLRCREVEAIPLENGSKSLPLCTPAQRISLAAWVESDEYGLYEDCKFTRIELARWLSVNSLASVYRFDLGLNISTTQSEGCPPKGGELTEVNTIKALALMAWLLAENKHALQIGGRPNAAKIGEAVSVIAKKAFGEDTRGFEAFHKKIATALKSLDGNPFRKI